MKTNGLIQFGLDSATADLQKQWCLQNSKAALLLGKDIFEEIVNVSDGHANQIHPNGIAQYHGESKQCPWQIRRQEVQYAKEVHANVWISS